MGVHSLRDGQTVWKILEDGEKWNDGTPMYMIDQTTDRKYWNESKGVVAVKCALMILVTIPYGLLHVAYRVFKLISLSHFWMPKKGKESYDFKARRQDAGQDCLRIVKLFIAIVNLERAAIYGLYRPYDGRKLYASIETEQYGDFVLAPCFQHDPRRHLLRSDPRKKNGF